MEWDYLLTYFSFQPMMPPYGSPYAAAIYPHGGIYAHPGIPIVSVYSNILSHSGWELWCTCPFLFWLHWCTLFSFVDPYKFRGFKVLVDLLFPSLFFNPFIPKGIGLSVSFVTFVFDIVLSLSYTFLQFKEFSLLMQRSHSEGVPSSPVVSSCLA